MECPACKQDLTVAKGVPESDIGSTDVYWVMTLICENPKCGNYAGRDRNNPLVVVATVRNKVN